MTFLPPPVKLSPTPQPPNENEAQQPSFLIPIAVIAAASGIVCFTLGVLLGVATHG